MPLNSGCCASELYQSTARSTSPDHGHIACSLQGEGETTMKLPLFQTGFVLLALSATNAQAQNRFQGMDSNHDGVITRAEWRGNAQSFRQHDWNGDGVLSGDEVRPGGQRQADRQVNRGQDWNRDGIVNNQDAQIAQRYRGY